MANNSTNQQQVAVNGETSGWDPTTKDQITLALAHNGGIKRVQATMRQRLDEAGWSQDLKEYCTRLFRSGEALTYGDARAIIFKRIQSGDAATNGASDGVPAPNLSIPIDAQHGGAEALKKELAQIVKHKK